MLAALLVVYREVLEAGIVTGVVLVATQGVRHRGPWICGGIAGGVLGSIMIAVFARQIANQFDGSGQELLNAAILGAAVLMLVWATGSMASQGWQMVAGLREMGHAVREGRRPMAAFAIVVGMAVLREGAEIVLFLYGIMASSGEALSHVAMGGVAGILCGIATSFVLYRGLVAIPLRHLFTVTGLLIALLAAGLASQAVGIVQGAGFLQLLSEPVWNTEWLLADDSMAARVLHPLVGYTAQPTGLQLLVYGAILATIAIVSRAINRHAERTRLRSDHRAPVSRAASTSTLEPTAPRPPAVLM